MGRKKAGNSNVQWSWIAGRDFHCYGKKTPRSCTKLNVMWRMKNLSRKFASSNNEPEQFHLSFLSSLPSKLKKSKKLFSFFFSFLPLDILIFSPWCDPFFVRLCLSICFTTSHLTFNIQLSASFHFSNIYHISKGNKSARVLQWKTRNGR